MPLATRAMMTNQGLTGVLYYATFTDTNSTPIASYVPEVDVSGNGLTVFSGVFNIFNPGSYSAMRATSTPGIIGNDTTTANVQITADLRAWSTGVAGGVCFRIQDSSNYIEFSIESGTTVVLRSVTAGVATVIDTAAYAYTSGDLHTAVCTANGTSIICDITNNTTPAFASVNGSTSAHLTETHHGMRIRFGGGNELTDELEIQGL